MKTFMARKEDVQRKWYLVDAEGITLGKLAVTVANILRGKDNPQYTPHVDTGDFIVIVNAEKVRLSGKKEEQKKYDHYTGYPGGLNQYDAATLRERMPERLITHAVAGMIPKNRLGRQMIKKLKVYTGPEHPHKAQQPEKLEI